MIWLYSPPQRPRGNCRVPIKRVSQVPNPGPGGSRPGQEEGRVESPEMGWKGRLSQEEQAPVAQCQMVGGLDTPSFALVRKMGKLLDKYEIMLDTREGRQEARHRH